VRPNWRLCLVADPACCRLPLLDVVAQAIEGGVDVVQLRMKRTTCREFLLIAQKIKSITDSFSVPFLVNDRVDIAKAAHASGVHLGQSDLPAECAREILGPDAMIGLSVHSKTIWPESACVNYIAVGPIFETHSKKDAGPGLGLSAIAGVGIIAPHVPVVGIGGINSKNARSVMESGAQCIAVISAICASRDPRGAARELRKCCVM